MTEEEFAALVTIKGIEVDVCWDKTTCLWNGVVVSGDKWYAESHSSRERLLHEFATRILGDAYDGKGITSADY